MSYREEFLPSGQDQSSGSGRRTSADRLEKSECQTIATVKDRREGVVEFHGTERALPTYETTGMAPEFPTDVPQHANLPEDSASGGLALYSIRGQE